MWQSKIVGPCFVVMRKLRERCRDTIVLYTCLTFVSLCVLWLRTLWTRGECLQTFYYNSVPADRLYGMDTGMDFLNSVLCAENGRPYMTYQTLYPPLANLFFAMLSRSVPLDETTRWHRGSKFWDLRWTNVDLRVHQSTLLMLIFFYIAFALAFVQVVTAILKERGTWAKAGSVALLFSYPSLFAIDRGNIVLVTTLLSLVFWFYRDSPSRALQEIAILALATAAALKVYPAALGLVLLARRQWLRSLRCALYGVVLGLGPFFCFEGSDAMAVFFSALSSFAQSVPISGFGVLNFCVALIQYGRNLGIIDLAWVWETGVIVRYGLVVTLVGLGLRENRSWKQALHVVLAVIVTQSSTEYMLLLFLIPFLAFLRERPRLHLRDAGYFVAFAGILLPFPVSGILSLWPYYTWKIASLQVTVAGLLVMTLVDGMMDILRANQKRVESTVVSAVE